jgi:exonuclease III
MDYSKDFLFSIRDTLPAVPFLPQPVLSEIRSLELNSVVPTKRGKRAGKHSQHPIAIHISNGSEKQDHHSTAGNTVDYRNLISVSTKFTVISPLKRNSLYFCLLNARSVHNKELQITDYIVSNNLNIVGITETWLGSDQYDQISVGNICPPGFTLLSSPRLGRGGGVAILINSSIKHRLKSATSKPKSFEYIEIELQTDGCATNLAVIYRPPPNTANKFTVSQFLDEFATFVEERILLSQNLCLAGDFNFHVDNSDNQDAAKFCDLLESFGLRQHVSGATHKKSHTLDLIITRNTDDLVENVRVDDVPFGNCDHYWIYCSILGAKSHAFRKEVSY